MLATRVLGAAGTLVLVAACSGEVSKPLGSAKLPPSEAQAPAHAPEPPARVPELPLTGERDVDGDRIDDTWQERLRAAQGDAALLADPVRLQVILTSPLEQAQLDDFMADGGRVEYVFRELSYGFVGSLPLGKLAGLARHWGARLHLLAAPSVVVPFLDEATRTGRVRGIWGSGFAGSASGYSGNANITIALLDTGIYEQHLDLSGRKQGWQDYTADAAANPRDIDGHGTHVTSIALGSGAAFGPNTATLKYTQSGSLSGSPGDTFLAAPIHTPAYFGTGAALVVSAQARFLGGGSARLYTMSAADSSSNYTAFGSVTGASPLALANQNGGSSADLYDGGLIQSVPPNVTNFAVANSVSNYPGVGDGFNALRGVAPTCKWFGAKVFLDDGSGTSFDIGLALDDLVSRRVADNIKIANLSLGVSGSGVDTLVRALVNTTVDAGILVVVAAGNDFPQTIGDPGRAAKAITVGASNDLNQLTDYTSVGAASPPTASEDTKPDVLAPGGSAYRSQILAADTGSADGNSAGFADLVADDYANLQGTSMATPFVSGALGLMVDALQQSGTSWSFASSAQPLFLKMLLLASTSETNSAREAGAGNNPTLGRAATLRDRSEGYGILNPDAAIEAMLQAFTSPLTGSVNSVLPARLEWERRAWGRNLSLVNGATVLLNLAVPATADYDLYLYSGTPDAKGNPVLRASSTSAGSGNDETINFVSAATETAYLFVKRVSGHGSFSLTGSAVSHCGDGNLDTGELCDPDIAGSEVCCTATCTTVSDGTTCSDGDACTQADSCQGGSCGGSPVLCAALDSCHLAGTCTPGTGVCTNPQKMDGATCNDGNACTQTDTCSSGTCTGGSPVVCSALDQCHNAGTCAPGTGLCSNPNKNNGTTCDDGNACTQTDTCQAGGCGGSNPVVCAASDQCHSAGTCAPGTGLCSNPAKANGANCDDGSKCTTGDTCQAGSCSAGTAVVCTASDQCHDAGTCAPGTGLCSNPAKANGAGCDDGNKCTQSESCQAGSCGGGSPVVCLASDQCHNPGSCAPATGLCSNPSKPSGASCDDGNACTQTDSCQAGSCAGASPVVCVASDQCHDAGSCDPANGACSDPPKADGTDCSDGSLCTQSDSCQAGVCSGAEPIVCVASGPCHDAGVCDPGTGNCSDPVSADGTACDDGDACTLGDACATGACQPADDVPCAPGDCHLSGSCDPSNGACAFASKPNGTACGEQGACQSGTCDEPQGEGGAGGETGAPGAAGDGTLGGSASGGSDAGGGALGANGGSGAAEPIPGAGVGPLGLQDSNPNTSSGCGCSVPGAKRDHFGAGLALIGLVLVTARGRGRRYSMVLSRRAPASSHQG